jgi:hypothetical protein
MSTTEKPRLKSTDGSDTDSLAANTDELQQDLERRLELLGPPTGNLSSELLSPSLVSDLNGKNKGGAVIHDGEQTNDSTHSNTRKPTVVTNKNVLLVGRVMHSGSFYTTFMTIDYASSSFTTLGPNYGCTRESKRDSTAENIYFLITEQIRKYRHFNKRNTVYCYG